MNIVKNLMAFVANRGLPSWARFVSGDEAIANGKPHLAEGYYEIDPDSAYPTFLAKIGFQSGQITQYHLEVTRRCFTQYLHDKIDAPLTAVIKTGSGRWALKNWPEGAGANVGAADFRRYYEAVKP